jgi:hypothetical protein
MTPRILILLGLCASVCWVGPASAGGLRFDDNPPAEAQMIPYSGEVPSCADPFVLATISGKFNGRESEYWGSGLTLDSFLDVSETAFRPHGPSYIPRRYCKARAGFNDGVARNVTFNIGEQLGFIGIGYGVTWCVQGLDRNHAFSPNCRAAGP